MLEWLEGLVGDKALQLPLLLTGTKHSGRTSLCLQIAKEAVERGKKVIYLTSDTPFILRKQAQQFDFCMVQAMKSNNFALLELLPQASSMLKAGQAQDVAEQILNELKDPFLLDEIDPFLLIIDSAEILSHSFIDEWEFRDVLSSLFYNLIEKGARIIVTTNHTEPTNLENNFTANIVSKLSGVVVSMDRGDHGQRASVLKSWVGEPNLRHWQSYAQSLSVIASSNENQIEPSNSPKVELKFNQQEPRLLVISDCRNNSFYFEKFADKGFKVKVVNGGLDAMVKHYEYEPEIILVDTLIENNQVFEMVDELRKANNDVPIVLYSSKFARVKDRAFLSRYNIAGVLSDSLGANDMASLMKYYLIADTIYNDIDAMDKITQLENDEFEESKPMSELSEKFGQVFSVSEAIPQNSTIVKIVLPSRLQETSLLDNIQNNLRDEDTVVLVENQVWMLLAGGDKRSFRNLLPERIEMVANKIDVSMKGSMWDFPSLEAADRELSFLVGNEDTGTLHVAHQ